MARIEQSNGLQSAHQSTRSLRGTMENLTDDGEAEGNSSFGSDSEVNGYANTGERQTDKYGFIGGAQQFSGDS